MSEVRKIVSAVDVEPKHVHSARIELDCGHWFVLNGFGAADAKNGKIDEMDCYYCEREKKNEL